ncbi:hypothetical protein FNV43_RR19059 [Rhamnella rubrinervis]|uniref:Uncharacterized protein n=1 Tax=Rhamnella rubrinervis TaxID=2594499 RepID=A0A8K0GWW6_9ROSA|nr:hypothetical protein FNV43_RR19059 [Rhamnella rubrinervis]
MAPLKRLRKASDKSTKATTVTDAAATKMRSREVKESSNALQDTPRPNLPRHWSSWPRGILLLIRDTSRPNVSRHRPSWPRGVLLLYTGYSSAKCVEASVKLAEGCPLVIYGILLGQMCRGIDQVGRGVSFCYIRDTPGQMLGIAKLAGGASVIYETLAKCMRHRHAWRGCLLLYTEYSSVKFFEASAKLAEGCPLIIYGIPLGQMSEASTKLAEGCLCYIRDTPRPNLPRHWPS